jgi:hypothetical protein
MRIQCVGHFIVCVPTGMFLSASVGWFFGMPSAGKTAALGSSVLFDGMIPVTLLDVFVLIPKWPGFVGDDARLKFLGGFLLVGGLLLQLLAAILDFKS